MVEIYGKKYIYRSKVIFVAKKEILKNKAINIKYCTQFYDSFNSLRPLIMNNLVYRDSAEDAVADLEEFAAAHGLKETHKKQ